MKTGGIFVTLLVALVLTACGGGEDGAEAAPFSDSFDAPGDWRTSSDPEVEIAYADGGLKVEIKVLDRVAWSVAGRSVKDGVVSVDATPIGGPDDNAYGLVIRHVDDRHFFRFEISSDGFFAVQAPQESLGWEYLVKWTAAAAIHPGKETNRLKVECQGPTMVFYVNDVELTRVQDDRYSEGDVGVIAGTFYDEAGTHILFDNFAVEPLNSN
jgi:hypothetical protein